MLRQFKFLLVLAILVFPQFLRSQDTASLQEIATADSLRELQVRQLRTELERLTSQYRRLSMQSERRIDSLMAILNAQSAALGALRQADDNIQEEVRHIAVMVATTRAALEEDRQRTRRTVLIAVPSLLIIILIASAAFFLLLNRYQRKTDASIRTLRKYTYEGLEEIRTDFTDEIRKRVKKILTRFAKKEKKGKKKKKGK
jgi:hypothetical protein